MSKGSKTLGEMIRRQREMSELSVRSFAAMVGISNPYLSQIERGLRKPSDRVLESIASQLDLSATTLYEYARARDGETPAEQSATRRAIAADPDLTARQRRVLLELYDLFTDDD
ncbi:MAG: helix-turn-helix domain-containing protein [Solirubrobacteraceae bacterium]